jgi:hypothetical protein
VELAWENYNSKLLECAALEETWTLKVDDCDDLQTILHEQACEHHSSNRQCAADFGHEYQLTMVAYNSAVTAIRQLEYDRKREWETLHIVTCLLETVYTHVIHFIQTQEPCPTTESHPDQTAAEINTCHIVEESMTANLTIDYGTPPPPPALPPVVEPPCTAQYIWDESGSFAFEIQASHSQTIQGEGLESYFTVLSAFGWAGCAAPKACTPCESTDIVVDEEYTDCATCLLHQNHLHPGQMDWDTFKCLGNNECIRASGRCNGHAQCADGSDELGCDTPWLTPAVLGAQECKEPVISDVQFQCGNGMCIDVAGKCNGVNNCDDGSDEAGCATTTTGLTVEAMTGFTATIETPAVGSAVFYDRSYTFDSLGSFTGHSFIKVSNEDKHIRHSHVQMKVRLTQPLTLYVAKLDDTSLPWLEAEGWTLTTLQGISYHGVHQTRHTEWDADLLTENHYGPGQVWQKTFTAGAVEMQGNNGGMGSYVMFAAHPSNAPVAPDAPVAPETSLYRYGDVGGLGFHGGAGDGNSCPTSDVSEADCLAAVQSLLPVGVSQGRANLVAGSWGWVPPGCSVQSHFTHGRDGDWAAHYNRGNGNNDGGYTKVCGLAASSQYHMLGYGMPNCPAGKTIDTRQECEAAHTALGLEISPVWTGTITSIPGLCSHRAPNWGGQHHLHFNNNAVGVIRDDLSPLCKA